MAIHMSETEKKTLMQSFNNKCETDGMYGNELEMEFSGVYTVHTHSLATYELVDYDKSQNPATGSRYGIPKDVEDHKNTYTMTQDKSLPLVIDKGDKAGQFNQKSAALVIKNERDNAISPYMDKYRLGKWSDEAGIHFELPSGGLEKNNIVDQIMEAHILVLEKNVPDNLTLTIKRTHLKKLKLSPEWVGLDSLGGKTLPKGALGEFDGMAVKTMPANRFKDGVQFMITHKGSLIAPGKVEDFKTHIDPPGLSGDLIEIRIIHDAFVIAEKADGVLAACDNGTVCAAPTIAPSSGKYAITSTTASAVIKYTTDGSDPRFSADAQVYTASISATSGTKIRAVATKAGMFASDVTDYTVV